MSAVSLAKYILVRLGSCTSTVTNFSNRNKKTKNANLNISAWSLVEQVNVHLPIKGFSEIQPELRYDITNVPIFSFHDIMANFVIFARFYVISTGFFGSWPGGKIPSLVPGST